MILTRWAAACTLGLVTMVGCQKTPKEVEAPAPVVTSDEKIAAAKAKYAALGALVGDVEAASDTRAAVSGIDGKAITKTDVLTFIDAATDEIVSHGTMEDVSASGRLVVKYDDQGTRAPKKGDICVKMKK